MRNKQDLWYLAELIKTDYSCKVDTGTLRAIMLLKQEIKDLLNTQHVAHWSLYKLNSKITELVQLIYQWYTHSQIPLAIIYCFERLWLEMTNTKTLAKRKGRSKTDRTIAPWASHGKIVTF